MPKYRDLIFLAVDYGKEDIAIRLANIGADLFRTEKVCLIRAYELISVGESLDLLVHGKPSFRTSA